MSKPRTIILSGYGLNCEEETSAAFQLAGSPADIVHINDLIGQPKFLLKYQILAIPGGFSYGDDTGSGTAYAHKLKHHLWKDLMDFIKEDRLVIGICNGCQILANLGLIPAINGKYNERQVALLHNDNARYTVRWVDVEVANDSPWLHGIKALALPIAHGEGKFFTPPKTLKTLKNHRLIALRYVEGEMCSFFNLPPNPTGTQDNIAGLTNSSGRVLGLMPHPERAVFFTQLPHWTYLREKYQGAGKKLPRYGPGLKVFGNAVNYFLGGNYG